MDAEELLAAAEDLEVDDLADLIAGLPETVRAAAPVHGPAGPRAADQRAVLAEDSAGGLMNTDTVSVRADVTLDVVQRYLRMRGELPDHTDRLFVVDRHDRFLGTLPLARLLTDDPDSSPATASIPRRRASRRKLQAHEVARLFKDRDLVSAAVVDDAGPLLGRITVDDVVDVIREEAAHEVMSAAGLRDEEDVFAGVHPVDAAPADLARHQPGHRVPGRRGGQQLRRHHREGRRAGRADADRRQHGRHRRHADRHADHPRHRARPGAVARRALAAVQGTRRRRINGLHLGRGRRRASTMVWFGTWKIAAVIAAAMLINLLPRPRSA